ncbi:MAG: DUF6438 domain-containing protein [Bacteroidota bacterium]
MRQKLIQSKFKKITLERTSGFVSFQSYSIEIYADGIVNLSVIKFQDKIGSYSWKIESEAVKTLNESIFKYGFFTMKGKEPTITATDMSFCNISILLENGRFREIEHYLGENKYPIRLATLENKIEKIIHVGQYIGKW